MSKITILDTNYATLWYHPESNIVHHVFHRFIYGEEFREVLNKGVEVFKERNAQKWLSDDRKNSALPTEDVEWSMTEWFPTAFESGWKYWAIVMPDKIAGQLNMNRFLKTYIERGLVVQVFENTEEAMNWLEDAG